MWGLGVVCLTALGACANVEWSPHSGISLAIFTQTRQPFVQDCFNRPHKEQSNEPRRRNTEHEKPCRQDLIASCQRRIVGADFERTREPWFSKPASPLSS